MKDNFQLENLLVRLTDRVSSEAELKELSDYFKEVNASGEINKYFLRIWETSHKYNTNLNSDNLLINIHNKCGINTGNLHVRKDNSRFISIMKYAAVFIIAFIISWLINNQVEKQKKFSHFGFTDNNEVTVSYGSKSKIKLPDGSIVTLNSGSKLTYPAVFADNNRKVNLEGEAYFEVKADSLRPFRVNTSELTIKVLGTVFNVKSYSESNTIETTLVSGSLEISDKKSFEPDMLKINKSLILKPNQKAIYIKNLDKLTLDDRQELKFVTTPVKLSKLSLFDKVDTQTLTAWKDNKLIFNNERFEDLSIKLERWYNVKITIKAGELRKERFTGTFENETIEQVLDALKIAEPFEYIMDKNNIVIFRSE